MISILILTYNEEVNISDCLRSVAWAEDVVVLDSFSTDRTVELAKRTGVRVMQRAFDTFAAQRNYGLLEGGLKGEWVLHLDADERVTPALHHELEIATQGSFDAYRVASKMIFRGKWLKHAGMYPAYQVRFGKQEALLFKQVGHGQQEAIDPHRVGTLQEPLLHYSFSKGLADWFERHNRYSSDEAQLAFETLQNKEIGIKGLWNRNRTERRRVLKSLSFQLPFRPLLRFIYQYVLCKGFLDGRAGLEYSLLMAIYEAMAAAKLRELQQLQEPSVAEFSPRYQGVT